MTIQNNHFKYLDLVILQISMTFVLMTILTDLNVLNIILYYIKKLMLCIFTSFNTI